MNTTRVVGTGGACYTSSMPRDVEIEGLLFYRATPQKKSALKELLQLGDTDLESALAVLHERLRTGALRLVETADTVALMTAPELAPLIERIRRDEMRSEIGKAGIETLAIILYREPISRAEIDRIRGVNSSFSLRTLLVRGLIERRLGAGGAHLFSATPALYAHLGITKKHELPKFAEIMNSLENFEKAPEPAASL